MKELAEIAKKYGATGVLAAWLVFMTFSLNNTQTRVKELENMLVDCYKIQTLRASNKNGKIYDFVKI